MLCHSTEEDSNEASQGALRSLACRGPALAPRAVVQALVDECVAVEAEVVTALLTLQAHALHLRI